MDSGEKLPPPPNKSPHSSTSCSSSASAALIDTKYPPFCESMGFPLPSFPLMGLGSLSPATISLEPKTEYLASKLSTLPSSSSSSCSLPKEVEEEEEEEEEDIPMVPRPLEALQGTPIPPFLSKTYELVDDSSLDSIISWGPTGDSFVVWDPVEFSRAVLPRHFKHNNFSSFVRQLNTYIAAEGVSVESQFNYQKPVLYCFVDGTSASEWRSFLGLNLLGFRKIGTDRWEFANENFMRGKRTLLKHINRRRSSQVQIGTKIGPSVEMAKAGIENEVQKLRREKDLLALAVVQLRQEHLMTVKKMNALNQRMQSAEVRQKQMVSFLAMPLQNPVFLGLLKQLKEQREIDSMRVRRKYLRQQQPASSGASDESMDHQIVKYRSGFWDAPASSRDALASSLLPDIETGEGSSALLPVFEHNEGKQLPEHLLQDVVGKLGLDAGGQEFFGGSKQSDDLKGKNLLSSQIDVSCPGRDYFISLPDDIIPDGMVSEDISPAGLTVSRPDSTIFTFKGKDIVNVEADAAAAGTEFLETLPEGIAQESMFPDAIACATDCASVEGMWNIGLDAGGRSFSSGHAVWDTRHYHAHEMEAEAGYCSLWDLGLHTFEEDLDIDKYVGGESSLKEPKDDDGQNEDCPMMMMEQ